MTMIPHQAGKLLPTITAWKADMTILQAAQTAAARLTARPPTNMDRKEATITVQAARTAAASLTARLPTNMDRKEATITVQTAQTVAASLTARPPSMDRKKVMTTQETKKTAAAKTALHKAPKEAMCIRDKTEKRSRGIFPGERRYLFRQK